MSRVGRLPVPIPAGVDISMAGTTCTVKGPKGTLTQEIHPNIHVAVVDGTVVVTRPNDEKDNRALHGLTRALVANMVTGVTTGFRKSLELQGTGYRAQLQGQNLVLTVGYSHPVEMHPLPGAAFVVETNTLLHVDGNDKQVVGQQAALIRRVRPPEPYHGKGVRYRGERIKLKAGKKTKGK
ncbi:MAG: 50S ribosomal protein L6 [Dehalococcoidia bacterium]|nr:MAG: 50S ribosomal protein L6 [Dehalococcoidia bacterium]